MNKLGILYFLILVSINGVAQVGINTTDPKRSLDINGGLRIDPGVVTNVMEVASQTLSETTKSSTATEKLDAELDYVKENYNKVLVSNGRGEVDYVDIRDFYAFSDKHLIYKSYVFELDKRGDTGDLPNTDFLIPGFLTANLQRLKFVTENNYYVEIKVKGIGSNYTRIIGRLLHDEGVVLVNDARKATSAAATFALAYGGPLLQYSNRLRITGRGIFGFKSYDIFIFRHKGDSSNDPIESSMFCKIRMAFNPKKGDDNKVIVGITIAYMNITE